MSKNKYIKEFIKFYKPHTNYVIIEHNFWKEKKIVYKETGS